MNYSGNKKRWLSLPTFLSSPCPHFFGQVHVLQTAKCYKVLLSFAHQPWLCMATTSVLLKWHKKGKKCCLAFRTNLKILGGCLLCVSTFLVCFILIQGEIFKAANMWRSSQEDPGKTTTLNLFFMEPLISSQTSMNWELLQGVNDSIWKWYFLYCFCSSFVKLIDLVI